MKIAPQTAGGAPVSGADPAPAKDTGSALNDLIAANPLPSWRPLAWLVMALLGIGVVWANFAQLDEVSVAEGEVVPAGRIKVIQHLEGGIISQIYVTEGDHVTEGQPLVQLDLASVGVNREELLVRLDGLLLTRSRLSAEADGSALAFPEDIAERRPQLVIAERNSYDARQQELRSMLARLTETAKERELEIQELLEQERTLSQNLSLARERFRMSQSLLSQDLVPRMQHLEREAEVESLQGELAVTRRSIPRARAALSGAQSRLEEETLRYRREAREALGQTELNIARTRELLAKAVDQELRTEIRSPNDGVVKNMRYHTIGGVVKPGEGIMEIVPADENLVIEARLNPVDRGYVEEGQSAVVKISTYDYARYGGLDGRVTLVAPDSSTDERQQPYFRVVVTTDKTWLGEEEGQFPISPGMQATVDIHTGTKSVMDYLVKPVLKLRHEAFRER